MIVPKCFMRGLASILLVFAAAIALISLLETYSSSREQSLETASYALELESTYYSKLDFTHSVLQSLSRGAKEGLTREEKAEGAAKKLSELSSFLKKNDNAELWCGIITESELNNLPRRISEAKKPLKCRYCWSAEQKTLVTQTFPEKKVKMAHKCLSFLDVDMVSGKIGVSKGGIMFTQDPDLIGAQFSGRFIIGISYYDEKTRIGSVSIIPEGTWVDYS
jgi:hypothetical protein